MDDLGAPSSYLALEPGVAVFTSDGEKVGEVQHVLADLELEIFDGIVIDASALPGGLRFADAVQVAEIYERESSWGSPPPTPSACPSRPRIPASWR